MEVEKGVFEECWVFIGELCIVWKVFDGTGETICIFEMVCTKVSRTKSEV